MMITKNITNNLVIKKINEKLNQLAMRGEHRRELKTIKKKREDKLNTKWVENECMKDQFNCS